MNVNSSAELAQLFHEIYERLAPSYGYKTREASAVAWEDVPEQNKQLMTSVCAEIMPCLLTWGPTTYRRLDGITYAITGHSSNSYADKLEEKLAAMVGESAAKELATDYLGQGGSS